MANECTICKKVFSKHCNLRSHVKRFHPDVLDEIAPNKMLKYSAACNKCSKTFVKYSNLKQHVTKFHPGEVHQLTAPKAYKHECKICKKKFSNMSDYKHHKKIHSINEHIDRRLRNKKCSLCEFICLSKLTLHEHFLDKHGVQISSKTMHFTNAEEFKLWKNGLEHDTHSSFVKEHGSNRGIHFVSTTYICHRSGYYIPKGTGQRHLKTQGSKKIDGLCPSEINVKIFENGEHEVSFIETHVGHDNLLGYLTH